MYNREQAIKGLLGKIDWLVENKRKSEELKNTVNILFDYLEHKSNEENLDKLYTELMKQLE